jgi:hypothetical protein
VAAEYSTELRSRTKVVATTIKPKPFRIVDVTCCTDGKESVMVAVILRDHVVGVVGDHPWD